MHLRNSEYLSSVFVCESVSVFHLLLRQVGMYHEQHPEDNGSSKENRMIYSESMPRRVGSFYRGEHAPTDPFWNLLLFGVSYELLCLHG